MQLNEMSYPSQRDMRRNPQLVSGKFTNTYTFKDATKECQEIAQLLNSMPGAQKDWKGWRKVNN